MKKVFRFVKGKKDERKESGGITSSHSGDLVSPAKTPEDERFLGLDNSCGYLVDFCGKDKTLTKLHKAAWQGNLEKLKSALKKVEIDTGDKHNRTALHFAVAQGHPNIVWFLLGNNAKTTVCDDEGHTPLLKAIECGHKECMTLLLERGVDVNIADYTGNTGLHVAVGQASIETVSTLLEKGADTEVSNNAGDFPLHIATRLESKELVDLLLQGGASVDVLDRENRTPLMLAAKSGNHLLVQLFAKHGAQLMVVDSNGWTAQDYAMLAGHENVAIFLKSFLKDTDKKTGRKSEESGLVSKEDERSWKENLTEANELYKLTDKCSKGKEEKSTDKEKYEESPESPDSESIPPYCQPPRSWEMIQAGMIDGNKNGHEPKRRSITTLGTLHSRRESFTESSISSPQFTLSLNRRKGAKGSNAFAKQRFSFNEKESIRHWINEEKTIRKDLQKIELENTVNLEEMRDPGDRHSASEAGWDSISGKESQDSKIAVGPDSEKAESIDSHENKGTMGRKGTMHEVEEIWVTNTRLSSTRKAEKHLLHSSEYEGASLEKEASFPSPPTALELGVDMAKSIKYMKGMSIDQPPGCKSDKNLWKNLYESHSLDCLEEKDFVEVSQANEVKIQGKQRPVLALKSEEVTKCQISRDSFTDVSRKIKEQLECYDQALRELAETSRNSGGSASHNYFSLPSAKVGGNGDRRRASFQELASNASSLPIDSGPHSLPLCEKRSGLENNESLGLEPPTQKSPERTVVEKSEDNLGQKTKRHILLAMRDVKHAVHVASIFKTSMDDQILSPLTRPEGSFDLDDKSNSKVDSSSSGGNSPPDENPFFGVGRQETVLERNDMERKSSSSGSGEEPTLWLQDGVQKKGTPSPDSNDDVSDFAPDEGSSHKRVSSFSPLGIIHREMEEELNSERNFVGRRTAEGPISGKFLCGESEEQNEEIIRDHSPDISLSSGPIEPIGAEKDSGSEPESSHCDASPTCSYALKSQHEWLKCHLKAATSEKIKLEELTARLAEKAERLQYELADAKEAAKSRDEVIRLLQDQLARMEAAYTKSLEESVQSRLQLTSHEQEILHLKELCYGYEEEKEASGAGGGGDFLQELHLRIKMLEEEKERMREEIIHLEEEKSMLEKRLEQDKREESEMLDQCQRWKERCGKLEEIAKAYDSKQAAYESYVNAKDQEFFEQENKLKQQNFQFETRFLELNEQNIELKAQVRCLTNELETEKTKMNAQNEKRESISELKKKNCELEIHFKNLEKEMEEKMVKKLREKEEEIGGLVKQFKRERDSLVASYEKKLAESRSGRSLLDVDEWKAENQRLKQTMENLRDQIVQLQIRGSVEDARTTLKNPLQGLEDDWDAASNSRAETCGDPRRLNTLAGGLRRGICESGEKFGIEGGEGERRSKGLSAENAEVKSEILELKSQVNSLRMVLGSKQWSSVDCRNQNFENSFNQKSELKRKGVGKEDELAWSNLYGMNAGRRRRGGRSSSVSEGLIKGPDAAETAQEEIGESQKLKFSKKNILDRLSTAVEEETEINKKFQKLEFIELKKEILSLQDKMTDEKNLRHALENQMIKMNLDLSDKENLEKEIRSLKRKVYSDYQMKSEMELFEFQKTLEATRDKYLGGQEGKDADDDLKAKCEVLAKEREKSETLRNFFARRAKSFECPPREAFPQPRFNSCPCSRPSAEFVPKPLSLALAADLKSKLERELDKSIKKYTLDCSHLSPPTVSNLQIGTVKKNYI